MLWSPQSGGVTTSVRNGDFAGATIQHGCGVWLPSASASRRRRPACVERRWLLHPWPCQARWIITRPIDHGSSVALCCSRATNPWCGMQPQGAGSYVDPLEGTNDRRSGPPGLDGPRQHVPPAPRDDARPRRACHRQGSHAGEGRTWAAEAPRQRSVLLLSLVCR